MNMASSKHYPQGKLVVLLQRFRSKVVRLDSRMLKLESEFLREPVALLQNKNIRIRISVEYGEQPK